MEPQEMRIIELSVQGIRKLVACDIQFTDGVNVIMGKTRQGKTSVLETLGLGLKGFRSKEPRDLINHGGDSGNIITKFEVGDKTYKVERILKQGKPPQLKLWLLKGDKPEVIASPQKFLDDLIPAIGETPGSFLKKTALEKLNFILKHHDVDMSEFEKRIQDHEAKRSELTAQQKLYAYAEKEPVEKPKEEVTKLEAAITEAQEANLKVDEKWASKVKEYKERFHAQETAYKEYKAVIDSLAPAETTLKEQEIKIDFEKKEIERLEKELKKRKLALVTEEESYASAKANLESTKAKVKKVDEPDRDRAATDLEKMRTDKAKELIDVTPLTKQLEELTAADSDAAAYKKDHESWKKKAEEIRAVNTKIRETKDLLVKALSSIPARLEGLVIEPGDENGTRPKGLYVDGIFSEEWSGAEGFAIAAKLLRRYSGQSVLIIDGGESIYYDSAAFHDFCEWARNDGVQVIISVVGEQDPDRDADKGFVIEDGGVREIRVKKPDSEDLL